MRVALVPRRVMVSSLAGPCTEGVVGAFSSTLPGGTRDDCEDWPCQDDAADMLLGPLLILHLGSSLLPLWSL
eukprot:9255675-Prorocentrum_lima.AAC.1